MYMLYRENNRSNADRGELLGWSRGGALQRILDECEETTVQSIRSLLTEKCAKANTPFTNAVEKSFTFAAAKSYTLNPQHSALSPGPSTLDPEP